VASLFAILLTQRGITGGEAIKALVFLTIIMTVVLQGLTARMVAKALKITSTGATGAVIVGCNPLGRLLGKLFQAQGESVVLIDTDEEDCNKARAENLQVFQSSGLDPSALEEAGLESMGTFIALTHNGEVNLVLAQRAVEEFQPPKVLAVYPPHASDNPSSNGSPKTKVSSAFISQINIKNWNEYIQDNRYKLGKTTLKEEDLAFQQTHLQALINSGELLPLLLRRNETLQVVKSDQTWQAKDEIIYMLHDSRPPLLRQLSGGTNYSRLALEKLPEVEEISISLNGEATNNTNNNGANQVRKTKVSNTSNQP
jgi:Trk K+ transport system NAD-binding subunit